MQQFVRRAAMFFALLAFATPASAVTVLSGSGTIDSTDSLQTDRVFRDGIASTWAAPKSFPGTTGSALFNYDQVNVTFSPNATQTIFYEIAWTNLNTTSPFSVAYLNAFNPATISQNYLGDGGASPTGSTTYQVVIPAGNLLILVFSSTIPSPLASAQSYEFNVSAFSDASRGENFGVVPLPAALPLFTTGLGALGLLGWRRKKAALAA